MAALEEEPQVVLGLPDRLVLVAALLIMATPAEVAQQEPTRRRQQTACPLLFPTISLDQVKTLAS